MSEQKDKSYLHGAAILAAAVVIVKIIGAIYRIPLLNILGTEGSAYYNTAYTIYTLLLTISTAGLPVALSKMISAANTLGRTNQVRRVFSVGRRAFLLCGTVFGLAMFLFAKQLSGIGNPETWYSIRALSPAMFFICLISAYRGYTQGHGDMVPTSISQMLEALCKLVFGLSLAYLAIRQGLGTPIASAGAIIGVSIGTAVAFLYMARYKRKMDASAKRNMHSEDVPQSGKVIAKQILRIGVPITLSASFLSIVNLLDTRLIYLRLQEALGMSLDAATNLHGAYSQVQTLYNLPAAIIQPITISFIPAITAYLARKELTSGKAVAESGLKMTNLLAMAAGTGLSVLSGPILSVIFARTASDYPETTGLLAIFGAAAYFVCLMLMTNAILQAYGFERYTVYTVLIGGIMKLVSSWVLLGIPGIGIYGAAIGTLLCYVAVPLLNLLLIRKRVQNPPRLFRAFAGPLFCTAVMGAAAWACYHLLSRLIFPVIDSVRLAGILTLGGAIAVAVLVYLILIIAMGVLTKEDVKMLPKGEKLAKLLHIR